MEGLEASVLRVLEIGNLNPNLRLDAEFFGKPALAALHDIRRGAHERVGDICARIQHPIEVKRDYGATGLLTIMAKNVRPNRVDLSDRKFMPPELETTVARNRLAIGDVLVTRTGANFGQVAPWKHDEEAFACADILVVRETAAPSGYLSSFLESCKGKPLVLRGGYGAAQPHIAPRYLADVLVPRFAQIERTVDALVNRSVLRETQAAAALQEAEDTLLEALGARELVSTGTA